MADDLNDMIDGAAGTALNDGDAGAAIIDPALLEQMRASGKSRAAPRATRPAEPEDTDEDEGQQYTTTRPASRPSDYRRFRKDELVDEAERLAQELRDERALRQSELTSREKTVDPDAVRELSDTIKFATSFGFAVVAQLRGPHWNTTPEQEQKIGDTGAKAMAPYASGITWLPWAQFGIVLLGTLSQKVVEDKRISALRDAPVDTGPDAVG